MLTRTLHVCMYDCVCVCVCVCVHCALWVSGHARAGDHGIE